MTNNGNSPISTPVRTMTEPPLEHKRAILENDLAEYIKARYNAEIRLKVMQRLESRGFTVTDDDKKPIVTDLARLEVAIELYESLLADLLES